MSYSPLEIFPNDLVKTVTSSLALNDVKNLTSTSKSGYSLFHTIANELIALHAVAHGAQDALINLIIRTIKQHPDLLFKKCSMVDPRGRIFPSISPYQLMIFLCDEVMKNAICPLIPIEMGGKRQLQYKELGCGGADLIRINKKPELKDIQEIRTFKTAFTINAVQNPVTFSLLENPDGIIFYQDEQDNPYFYYVNPRKQELKCLTPEAKTEEAQLALDALIASFMAMEMNSGRRSNDAEHQLIQQIMSINLHREGIRYKQDGLWFQDSRTEFKLINKYRTCIRLYYEAVNHGGRAKADNFGCEEVGKAQGEVMWLLQRICEKDRPFYPLPKNFSGFKRGFAFDNSITNKNDVLIFSEGKFDDGFGKDFYLNKGPRGGARDCGPDSVRVAAWRRYMYDDLIAVCRLVESAKVGVVEEFKPNQDLEPQGVYPK